MALAAGTRVGSYEIVSLVGAGGMGEVYRARDARLQRDVAIKILPASFAADADRVRRFEREAQALAALNHPNVAHIHGVEEHAHGPALIMEFVEGPTLADRINAGLMRPEDALPIARQIAEALEAAHESGIIHRDLKPANVKLGGRGDAAGSTVKVLDFGLAKAMEGDISGATKQDPTAPDSSTKLSPAMTQAGIVLGTAAYMSPEQARAGVVDRRADIWAFGCVLFEMLSGRPAFDGETVTDVLAAVVKDPPPWQALPAETPAGIRRLLGRCLEKQPRRRLHHIADARLEIEEAIDAPKTDGTGKAESVVPPGRMRLRERLAWMTAAVLAITAGALIVPRMRAPAALTVPVQRYSLVHRGSETRFLPGPPQISPDGRCVVYSAEDRDGRFLLWVRDLDGMEPRRLAGTERYYPGQSPFWHPDSRTIGFFGDDELKRVSADGGAVQALVPTHAFSGQAATWSRSGVILYQPMEDSPLFKIAEGGGKPEPVTTLPGKGWGHMFPSFLPDGQHFLFTARPYFQPFDRGEAGIYLGSLDGSPPRRLLPDVSNARYVSPGYLLFARGGVLNAVPFDATTGRLTGDPISLKEKVTVDMDYYQASFSVSVAGVIALRQAVAVEGLTQVRLIDRRGTTLTTFGDPRAYTFASIAPSGRQVAFGITDVANANGDIWIADADGRNLHRFVWTRDWEAFPIWRDETHLTYLSADVTGAFTLTLRDTTSGRQEELVKDTRFMIPFSWSADGAYLIFERVNDANGSDLHVWSSATKKAEPFVSGIAGSGGTFSPDGRWVAYNSSSGGSMGTHIARFPKSGVSQSLPVDAAVMSWSRDGREILAISATQDLVAYPITVSSSRISIGQRTVLIPGPTDFGPRIAAFPDHSKLLVASRIDPEKGVAEIRLIVGLIDALRAGRIAGSTR